jgi:ABC-type branched-subunit amino acid transport system ATPase component
VAAATAGVDPVRTKLVLFAVSAGLAGFAGALFALVNSPITSASAPPLLGLVWLAVAVTFGIRRPGGAVLAGLVYAAMPVALTGIGANWEGAPWSWLGDSARHLIASPELAAMLFGLGAVGLAREPDGILAEVGHAMRARRQARHDRSAERDAASDPLVPSLSESPDRASTTDAGRSVAAVSGEDPALELRGIHGGYGEVEVLHGVDLVVPRGGVVAVVGANGAGKSTLCAVAAGTVTPTSGQVLLDGIDRTQTPPHERARAGLVLAPEARGIFPGLSVDDNLAVRLRTPEARQAARARFPILAERGEQPAGLLSGGEQQQLAMAVALADPPTVFLADEPSLGLAPMAVKTVLEALAELRDLGCSLVLVEEQAGPALALADQVVIMELGRVSWVGPASEVDLDQLTGSYLGG